MAATERVPSVGVPVVGRDPISQVTELPTLGSKAAITPAVGR
jgi:hypothetical protein